MNLNKLKSHSPEELGKQAKALGLQIDPDLPSTDVILAIVRTHAKAGGTVTSSGTLEILGDGFGFLRSSPSDYSPTPQDIYVSPSQIRRFHLNTGDKVEGQVRPPKDSERYFALLRVEQINDSAADKASTSQGFTERRAIYSSERLQIEHKSIESRLFDLLCPIGKGQRVLLFAPPRCDPGALLLEIAKAASHFDDELDVVNLLLAGRPEFVSEFQEAGAGGVFASTFDEPAQRHTQLTDMVLENAKREADTGRDVLVLVDSLTRLASAASLCSPSAVSNLPSGMSPKGLQAAKRLFAAGRNLDGAGSVTIIAVLRDAGEPIDEFLRQEMTPAANCLMHLSSDEAALGLGLPLAADRFFNSEEARIVDEPRRDALSKLRRRLADSKNGASLKTISEELAQSKNNSEFLNGL